MYIICGPNGVYYGERNDWTEDVKKAKRFAGPKSAGMKVGKLLSFGLSGITVMPVAGSFPAKKIKAVQDDAGAEVDSGTNGSAKAGGKRSKRPAPSTHTDA